MLELAGEGDDDSRARTKRKVRAAREELNSLHLERTRLEKPLANNRQPLTKEQVRAALRDISHLLEDAASGRLGEDVVYKAAEVFRQLVGERVTVKVERRAGRTRVNVLGLFTPYLLNGLGCLLESDVPSPLVTPGEVRVWLREPPLRDRLAPIVHQLMDKEGHSYRSAAKELQRQGHNINSGVVYQIRQRYFEMQGLTVPKLPYNNGINRRRDSRLGASS